MPGEWADEQTAELEHEIADIEWRLLVLADLLVEQGLKA